MTLTQIKRQEMDSQVGILLSTLSPHDLVPQIASEKETWGERSTDILGASHVDAEAGVGKN